MTLTINFTEQIEKLKQRMAYESETNTGIMLSTALLMTILSGYLTNHFELNELYSIVLMASSLIVSLGFLEYYFMRKFAKKYPQEIIDGLSSRQMVTEILQSKNVQSVVIRNGNHSCRYFSEKEGQWMKLVSYSVQEQGLVVSFEETTKDIRIYK